MLQEILSSVGTHEIHETETRVFDRPTALTVETVNGDLTLDTHGNGDGRRDADGSHDANGADDPDRAHDTDSVRVVAETSATSRSALADAQLVAEGGDGEPLAVRVEHDGETDGSVRVDLDVTVPADLDIEHAATTNGECTAHGVTLHRVEATNGGCEVIETTGALHAETTNGDVTVRGVDGDVRLSSTNGHLSAESVDGYVAAEATTGGITVRDPVGIDDLATTAGRIDADVPAVRGATTVESATGAVRLRPGPELDASVTASTSVGSVTAPALGSAYGLGTVRVEGTFGEGGPTLSVSTHVGSITVEE